MIVGDEERHANHPHRDRAGGERRRDARGSHERGDAENDERRGHEELGDSPVGVDDVPDATDPDQDRPGSEGIGSQHPTTVERDPTIDVIRGALVVALVFVEYLPPSPDLSWLRHSPWNGIRFADVVFPGFLFVAGASMAVGGRPRWTRVLRRALVLLALGIVFNAATETSPLRLTGVLQTIAITGVVAAIVFAIAKGAEPVTWVACVLLVIHGALLSHAFSIDGRVFGSAHLYREGALGHDPEGVLNTVLGATAVVLLGWVARRVRSPLFVAAAVVAGVAASAVWEPNKRAWTPSFALLMVALFSALLLPCIRMPILEAVGRNALLVYVGQHVVRETFLHATGGTTAEQLTYALVATVVWSALAFVLGRVGVRLRT